jgi:hypothetical protein
MSVFNGISNGAESLSGALGFVGQIFAEIIQNEYASYAIVLFCLAAITATVLESVLSKLPIFQGSSSTSNKGAKIVAWCFSAIGIVGIHVMFKDQGITGVVTAFAGPVGAFFLLGIVFFVWFSIYKNMENSRPGARRAWSTFVAGFIFFWLLGAIRGGENYLGAFIAVSIISAVIAGLSYFGGQR